MTQGKSRGQHSQPHWSTEIYERERGIITAFFGEELDVSPLPDEITSERVANWNKCGMVLHFLPDVDLLQDCEFPGWNVKPYSWFFERVQVSDILDNDPTGELVPEGSPLNLGNRWVLIDERDKPIDKPDQVYANDFLYDHIAKLATDGKIERNPNMHPGTRLFTSWNEWHELIRPEVARILGVRLEQVRLPRVVEFNYFGNAIKPQWGETDTWEWLQEACAGGKYRLRGGHSFAGGLAIVYWRGPAGHGTDRGFRPVVDFG